MLWNVPDEGFEPPTFGLQNRCTTAVLIRRPCALAWPAARRNVALPYSCPSQQRSRGMTKDDSSNEHQPERSQRILKRTLGLWALGTALIPKRASKKAEEHKEPSRPWQDSDRETEHGTIEPPLPTN